MVNKSGCSLWGVIEPCSAQGRVGGYGFGPHECHGLAIIFVANE